MKIKCTAKPLMANLDITRLCKLNGRHYSVDWTTGLDYWTGLLDSRKLPLAEKGTAIRRAIKTPGHNA